MDVVRGVYTPRVQKKHSNQQKEAKNHSRDDVFDQSILQIAERLEEEWGKDCGFLHSTCDWLGGYSDKGKLVPPSEAPPKMPSLDYVNILFQDGENPGLKDELGAHNENEIATSSYRLLRKKCQPLVKRLKTLPMGSLIDALVKLPEYFPLELALQLFGRSFRQELSAKRLMSRFTINKFVRIIIKHFEIDYKLKALNITRKVKLCLVLAWIVIAPQNINFWMWLQKLKERSLWISAKLVPELYTWHNALSVVPSPIHPKTFTYFLALIWSKLAFHNKLVPINDLLGRIQQIIPDKTLEVLGATFPSALAIEKVIISCPFSIDIEGVIEQIVHSVLQKANKPILDRDEVSALLRWPALGYFLRKRMPSLRIIETTSLIIVAFLLSATDFLHIFSLDIITNEAEVILTPLPRLLIHYRAFLDKKILLAGDEDISRIANIIISSKKAI